MASRTVLMPTETIAVVHVLARLLKLRRVWIPWGANLQESAREFPGTGAWRTHWEGDEFPHLWVIGSEESFEDTDLGSYRMWPNFGILNWLIYIFSGFWVDMYFKCNHIKIIYSLWWCLKITYIKNTFVKFSRAGLNIYFCRDFRILCCFAHITEIVYLFLNSWK